MPIKHVFYPVDIKRSLQTKSYVRMDREIVIESIVIVDEIVEVNC